jgi:hypothetical protein
VNPIQKIPGVLRAAHTSGEVIEPHSQSNDQPRWQNLSPTQSLIAPRLTERTVTPLSPDAPRSHASSSSTTTTTTSSAIFKKTTFKSIPDHLLPLIASFCNKPMQTLTATWIANFDNPVRPITPAMPESLVIDMLHIDGMQLALLPMAKRSLAVCRAALQQDALAWPHIPRYLRESPALNLISIATGKNGLVLRHLIHRPLTPAQKEAAVANNAMAVAFIPASQRSPSMYRAVVAQATQNSRLLQMVREEDRTLEMYELAIKENTLSLKDVPLAMQSYNMYKNAVNNSGWNLRFVPIKMRDLRLCVEALKNCSQAIEFVPTALKAKPLLWRAAIAIGAQILIDVPEELRLDGAIIREALGVDGTNLRFIPPNQRSFEMCELAVTQNGFALRYVPVNLKTNVLIQKAVIQNGAAIGSLPMELRNELPAQVIDAGLRSNSMALMFVPPLMRTMQRCLDVVRREPVCIKFVPAIHLLNNEELQGIAFSQYRDRLPNGWKLSDALGNTSLPDGCIATTSTSSSSASSTLSSFEKPIPGDRKSNHIALASQATPLMMEHLVELNNYPGTNFNLRLNLLYQGIPDKWVSSAQDCINFMFECSIGFHVPTEAKIYSQDLGHFELMKSSGEKNLKATNAYTNMAASLIPALSRNPMLIKMVPERAKTAELCMLAVRKNGLAIAYVPPHLRNEAMCLVAFANTGHAVLPFIRHDLYDQLR